MAKKTNSLMPHREVNQTSYCIEKYRNKSNLIFITVLTLPVGGSARLLHIFYEFKYFCCETILSRKINSFRFQFITQSLTVELSYLVVL